MHHAESSHIFSESELSQVCSGNHCRSDPVQVQSTIYYMTSSSDKSKAAQAHRGPSACIRLDALAIAEKNSEARSPTHLRPGLGQKFQSAKQTKPKRNQACSTSGVRRRSPDKRLRMLLFPGPDRGGGGGGGAMGQMVQCPRGTSTFPRDHNSLRAHPAVLEPAIFGAEVRRLAQ